jgi:hypothetical protein
MKWKGRDVRIVPSSLVGHVVLVDMSLVIEKQVYWRVQVSKVYGVETTYPLFDGFRVMLPPPESEYRVAFILGAPVKNMPIKFIEEVLT